MWGGIPGLFVTNVVDNSVVECFVTVSWMSEGSGYPSAYPLRPILRGGGGGTDLEGLGLGGSGTSKLQGGAQ